MCFLICCIRYIDSQLLNCERQGTFFSQAADAVNIIRVTVMDECGAACGWVCTEDIALSVSRDYSGCSSVGSLHGITVEDPGVFDIVYRVCESVSELWLGLSVCGVPLTERPLRVCRSHPFQTHLGSVSFPNGRYGGMAISPDGALLVMSCCGESRMDGIKRRLEYRCTRVEVSCF